MTSIEMKDPLIRPNTPPKISWFEFLLDDSLLATHLGKDSPDPSPLELMKLFMYQADSASQAAKELPKETAATDDEQGQANDAENRKIRALRILALKTAAFLKWDLGLFQGSVPIPMAYALLVELLKLTLPPGVEFGKHSNIDLPMLEQPAYFALSLFHRWCCQIVVKISFPERPSKIGNVQVPGFLDPTVTNPAAVDMVLKVAHENITDSVLVLEKMTQDSRDITMPTGSCFMMLNENTDDVSHDWDVGHKIHNAELLSLIYYDIGSFLFFKEQYPKAHEMFKKCLDCCKKVADRVLPCPDQTRLKNYCHACRNILQIPPPLSEGIQSLHELVEQSRTTNYQGLVELLTEDNVKQELDMHYREALKHELASQTDRSYLHSKVMAMNSVRRAASGMPVESSFIQSLRRNTDGHKYLIKVLEDTYLPASSSQQRNIETFLRYLVPSLPEDCGFVKKLHDSKLGAKLPASLLMSFVNIVDNTSQKVDLLQSDQVAPSGDSNIHFGELEKLLIWTYDPKAIQELTSKLLQNSYKKYNLIYLSDKWRLVKEMFVALDSLNSVQDQVTVHIMIAKARHCMLMKLYRQASQLLSTAELVVRDRSYRLNKMIRWEALLVELMQFGSSGSVSGETSIMEVTKKVKTCITSLALEQDLNPSSEVLEHCAAYLLSIKEWDYLASLTHLKQPYLEVARLISAMCREANVIKNARKSAREFWEAVLLMFATSVQQKRNVSGGGNIVQRDSQMGIMTQTNLVNFLTKIRDPLTLSVILSCLTKLFNIIKDDITVEISSEYIVLWPLTVGSTNNLNTEAVTIAVHKMMSHALSVDPYNPVFLRTQADIHYAATQYSKALKYYLQGGASASLWFTEIVPKNVFDEQVYKRMIRCCNYLHCYTQVAVLCQCTEEVDYSTAFKAVQEKNSNDAMDTYYEFIWDNTLLEYLINLHARRGEMDKKKIVLQLIGQPELNSSNPQEILHQAAETRKAKFFKTMAKLYL